MDLNLVLSTVPNSPRILIASYQPLRSRTLAVCGGTAKKIGINTSIRNLKISSYHKRAELPPILTLPIFRVLWIVRRTSISSICRRIRNKKLKPLRALLIRNLPSPSENPTNYNILNIKSAIRIMEMQIFLLILPSFCLMAAVLYNTDALTKIMEVLCFCTFQRRLSKEWND